MRGNKTGKLGKAQGGWNLVESTAQAVFAAEEPCAPLQRVEKLVVIGGPLLFQDPVGRKIVQPYPQDFL